MKTFFVVLLSVPLSIGMNRSWTDVYRFQEGRCVFDRPPDTWNWKARSYFFSSHVTINPVHKRILRTFRKNKIGTGRSICEDQWRILCFYLNRISGDRHSQSGVHQHIIWQTFCRKLHENERIRTERGRRSLWSASVNILFFISRKNLYYNVCKRTTEFLNTLAFSA